MTEPSLGERIAALGREIVECLEELEIYGKELEVYGNFVEEDEFTRLKKELGVLKKGLCSLPLLG
jgi:hypothetical protein